MLQKVNMRKVREGTGLLKGKKTLFTNIKASLGVWGWGLGG